MSKDCFKKSKKECCEIIQGDAGPEGEQGLQDHQEQILRSFSNITY